MPAGYCAAARRRYRIGQEKHRRQGTRHSERQGRGRGQRDHSDIYSVQLGVQYRVLYSTHDVVVTRIMSECEHAHRHTRAQSDMQTHAHKYITRPRPYVALTPLYSRLPPVTPTNNHSPPTFPCLFSRRPPLSQNGTRPERQRG